MDQQLLLERCQQLSGTPSSHAWTPDDAIGFFQAFRPDGAGLTGLFDDVPNGDELWARLRRVFAVGGNSLRPDGAHDAYFIIRRPPPISPEAVEQAGRRWLDNLARLDQRIGDGTLSAMLAHSPRIRVLEGKPPKHPRDPAERSELLKAIVAFSDRFVEPLQPADDAALALRRAYYFIACDAFLRDYLLWPLYRQLTGMTDPLEDYFTLWQHGTKYRIFSDEEVDFYIPRQH